MSIIQADIVEVIAEATQEAIAEVDQEKGGEEETPSEGSQEEQESRDQRINVSFAENMVIGIYKIFNRF